MADYAFVPTKVLEGDFQSALRLACLRPFSQADFEAHDVVALNRLVQVQRNLLLSRLHRSGVIPWLADAVKLQYARNCPPIHVLTDDAARCCRRVQICPDCWGRGITKPLMTTATGVLGLYRGGHPLTEGFLIEFRQRVRWPWDSEFVAQGRYFRWLEESPRDLLQRWGSLGAWVIRQATPHRDYLQLTRQGIFFTTGQVPANTRELTFRAHPGIRRKALAEVVGRVARFPRSYLAPEAFEFVLSYLQAIHGRRLHLSGTYGCLRGHLARTSFSERRRHVRSSDQRALQ